MAVSRHRLSVFGLCVALSLLWAGALAQSDTHKHPSLRGIVARDYARTSQYRLPFGRIELLGSARDIDRLSGWLDQIFAVPHGRRTLLAILSSEKKLTIRSSTSALQASGRTLAPMTADLINGRGADVEILFDARIPDEGSHRVYGEGDRLIDFTAVQNLYHELAHAKHMTNGTWRYADPEAQAIDEENLFRAGLSEQQGQKIVSYRIDIRGLQVWHPAMSHD